MPALPPAPRPPPNFWARLTARYDLQALQPPEELAPPALQAAMTHPAWPALLAWCHEGGPWAARPWPDNGASAGAPDVNLAHTLGLVLDGSLRLRACRGAASRLGLKLRTKLNDVSPWRVRLPADPWDAGWLRPGSAGLQALQGFQPRRPTLLVAGPELGAPHQQAAQALLAARPAQARHALRLLVLRA